MLRWLKKKQTPREALEALDAKLPREIAANHHAADHASASETHHAATAVHSAPVHAHPTRAPAVHADLDARATNAFYLADGSAFWTLTEFGNALLQMSDETFGHHVHDGHNDFASWTEGCFEEPNRSFATSLRVASRQEMIKLLLPELEARQPSHALAPATEHLPATLPQPPLPKHLREHTHEQHVAYAHKEAAHHHAKQEEEHLTIEMQPTIVAEAIHAKPLPHSPLDHPDARTKHVLDKLHAIELEAKVDALHAREEFIETRTHVWSELSEDERKLVLPTLRSVYEALLKHPITLPRPA